MFPFWTVLPFLTLLACIALLPVVAEHFWHNNLRKGLIALGLSVPVLTFLAIHQQMELAAESLCTSTSILFCRWRALYVIAGGIVVHGNFRPTPLTNTLFLAAGGILANVIGTTGASMLLVRPLLRINRNRQHHRPVHRPVLHLRGRQHRRDADAARRIRAAVAWLSARRRFLLDALALARVADGKLPDPGRVFRLWTAWSALPRRKCRPSTGHFCVEGLVNIMFLIGVLTAVVLHLPAGEQPDRGGDGRTVAAVHAAAAATRQRFPPWEAMIEEAVLFAGIFVTMIPPLKILEQRGGELGISEPWQFFWLTGGLSAFLDNAPTYLTFATVAAGSTRLEGLMATKPHLLGAISCGAVFMER